MNESTQTITPLAESNLLSSIPSNSLNHHHINNRTSFIDQLSSWRKEPLVQNYSTTSSKKVLLVQEKDKFITCITQSEAHLHANPFVAVGAGSKRNNLFLSIDNGDELAWRSTFTTPTPIYSLSWSGSYLLSGHWDGCISLLKPPIDFLKDPLNPDLKETRLLIKTQYNHPNDNSACVPRPNRYPVNSRVSAVEFLPTPYDANLGPSAPKFFSLFKGGIYLWDVTSSKAPISSLNLSDELVRTANWSPNFIAASQLVATGDLQGMIRLVDMRANQCVWETNSARMNSWVGINQVRWSPFIPYWLASAGNDGRINIWDIRYSTNSVAQLEGSMNSFSSVDWSNTHSDMLFAGSHDHRTYLFSLNRHLSHVQSQSAEPSQQGLIAVDRQTFSSPITAVLRSGNSASCFYTISEQGELGKWNYNYLNTSLSGSIPHRVPETQKALYRIEEQIYQRQLGEASKQLIQLIQNPSDSDISQIGLDMICEAIQGYPNDKEIQTLRSRRVLIQGQSTKSTDQKVDEEKTIDPLLRFRADVQKFSYGVPFRTSPVRPLTITDLDANFMKVSFDTFPRRLRSLIESKSVKDLFKLGNEITDLLVYSYSAPTVDLVTEIMKHCLAHDCSETLLLAKKMIEKLQTDEIKSKDYTILAPLIYLLFYPTIYDSDIGLNSTGASRSSKTSPPAKPQRSASRRVIKKDISQNETTEMKLAFDSTNALSNSERIQTLNRSKTQLNKSNSGSPAFAQNKISKLLADHFEAILPMLQLEIEIQRIATTFGSDTEKASQHINEMMLSKIQYFNVNEVSPHHITISSGAVKLFLNALLQQKRYEDYLLYSNLLDRAFSNCDIIKMIKQQANSLALPRFRTKLERLIQQLKTQLSFDLLASIEFTTVLRFLLRLGIHYRFQLNEAESLPLIDGLKTLVNGYRALLPSVTAQSQLSESLAKLVWSMLAAILPDLHQAQKGLGRTSPLPTNEQEPLQLIRSLEEIVDSLCEA